MSLEDKTTERMFQDSGPSVPKAPVEISRKSVLLIAACIGTAAFSAWAASFLWTPMYRAEALLVSVTDDETPATSLSGGVGSLALLAGINLSSGTSSSREAVALLKSKGIARKMIESNNLLPTLFPEKWDTEEESWKDREPLDQPTLWMGIKQLNDHLRVSEDIDTGLVSLSIEWSDPAVAAAWVNEIVRLVNEEMRLRAVLDATRSLEYLNQELEKTATISLRESIFKLIESQTKNLMLAKVRDEFALRVVDAPMAPDVSDFVRPKRLLIAALGGIFGAMFGLAFVVGRSLGVVK